MRPRTAHASTAPHGRSSRALLRGALAFVLLLGLEIGPSRAALAAVGIQPGEDIQAAIDGHDAGTTFRLAAGVWYQSATIRPKAGDRFLGAGAGQTILDGGGLAIDGFGGSEATTGVEIAHLTVRGFVAGVRTASGWLLRDIEATSNEIGVRMNGSGTVVRYSSLHHNARFGVLGSTDQGAFLSNDVSFNRTDPSLDPGYSGAAKWVNSTGLLVDGNRVHDNYGKGIWLDIEDRGCTLSNNQVFGNLQDGIRVEISYDSVVQGNRVEGNGGTAVNVLNSSGTLVAGNTISAPVSVSSVLRFAGNGRSDGGVEYANTNNRAQANDVRLATGQTVGVVRVTGTTSGNSYEANSYLVPSVLESYFRWWDGVQSLTVGWSDWQGFGQDLTGSLLSSTSPPSITGFSPTRGHTGITVTILGTSLTGTADVSFSGVSARFHVDSDTQISATVPKAATTGPIEVTSPGGTATSARDFTLVPRTHGRSVSFSLRGALLAEGRVGVRDGFPDCKRRTPVEIQRWVNGKWRTIATPKTNDHAAYRARLPERPGRYRARLSTWDVSSADTCGAAVSRPASHP